MLVGMKVGMVWWVLMGYTPVLPWWEWLELGVGHRLYHSA